MGIKDIRYYKEVELTSWLAFLLSLTWIGQCLVICSLDNLFWLCSYLSINGYYILIYSNTELAFWLWSHLSIKGHCSYLHLQPHRVDLLQCEVSLVQEENFKQEVLREPHQSLTGSDFSVPARAVQKGHATSDIHPMSSQHFLGSDFESLNCVQFFVWIWKTKLSLKTAEKFSFFSFNTT